MKTKNRIWIFSFMLMGMVLMFTNSCKKDSSSSSTTNGWSALGDRDLNDVRDLYLDKAGNLYAVGFFKNSSDNYYVAKWNGSSWSEVGTLNINGSIFAITGDANGNLYIGGSFTDANGSYYVAKWNGSTWTNIGYTASSGDILPLCNDAGGYLFAGGDTRVFEWNGSSWSALNMTGYDHWVNTLLVANGSLYVGGGAFTAGTGGCVAKWNGNGWSTIGDLNSYEEAYTLCTDVNGNLYAGGGFDFQSGYVVKLNGSSWTNLGLNANDMVKSICTDGKGNLYAGGSFYNSSNKFYVAKWDGSSWTDMGLDAYSGINKLVYSNGSLYVAGLLEFILNSGHYIAVYK